MSVSSGNTSRWCQLLQQYIGARDVGQLSKGALDHLPIVMLLAEDGASEAHSGCSVERMTFPSKSYQCEV